MFGLLGHGSDLALDLSGQNQSYFMEYKCIADHLKNLDQVNELVSIIKKLKDLSLSPFIVMENSSGTGKTQMAFTLMARKDLEVLYIPCSSKSGEMTQEIYTVFSARSTCFSKCVEKDLPAITDSGVGGIDNEELYIYTFILALLNNQNNFVYKKSLRSDVFKKIESIESERNDDKRGKNKKQVVVFLDEFPSLSKKKNEHEIKGLRFMRNVFRSFKLVVIISATNGTARNLIGAYGHSRGRLSLWCVVFPWLPRFVNTVDTKISDKLNYFVTHSRPLFAKHLIEYHQRNPLNETMTTNFVDYFDTMVGSLAKICLAWKGRSFSFFLGQFTLFLCSSFIIKNENSNIIDGHFGCLQEQKPFNLHIVKRDSKSIKLTIDGVETEWKFHAVFPNLKEDLLLFCILSGGKYFHPLEYPENSILTFHTALELAERGQGKLHFSNTNQVANDGMRMEVLVSGSVIVASHSNGFQGIKLKPFIISFLNEIGITLDRNCLNRIRIPDSISKLVIPFCSPPNVEWPISLPTDLNVGNFIRTDNKSKIDFKVILKDNNGIILTGESKDRQDTFGSSDMIEILKRIPPISPFHLVVINNMISSEFLKGNFDNLIKDGKMKKEEKCHNFDYLYHACFYRVDELNGITEISGIENKCRAPDCGCNSTKMDKLIFFVNIKLPTSKRKRKEKFQKEQNKK